jgi:hypothetical protein
MRPLARTYVRIGPRRIQAEGYPRTLAGHVLSSTSKRTRRPAALKETRWRIDSYKESRGKDAAETTRRSV